MILQFTVYCKPQQMGSKSAVVRGGHAQVVDSNKEKLANWSWAVSEAARIAMEGRSLIDGPVRLSIEFYFVRPKGHFRASGQLRLQAPRYHAQSPDLSKLIRSTEDAMSGIVYRDDSLVCRYGSMGRNWLDDGGGYRAEITVEELIPHGPREFGPKQKSIYPE